ncbi:MAG: hypothetical protein HEQ39_02810 [Rhizobacter sp.]
MGSCLAQAELPEYSNFRFSGFGTIGFAHVAAPEGWAYRRDLAHSQSQRSERLDLDSRLGLQLNYVPSPNFELTAQAIVNRRAPAANDGSAIEWAFAAYRPNADWTVRLGRVNLDAFVLSEYRNVGFAYVYARPPVEFYAQLPSSLDGADATRTWNIDGALWRAKAFAGQTKKAIGDDSLYAGQVFGGMVSREAEGLLLRASLFQANLTFRSAQLRSAADALVSLTALPIPSVAEQAHALRSRLMVEDLRHRYVSLGTRYEARDWVFGGELLRVTGSRQIAFSAEYASIGRRLGPLTVYGLVSRVATTNAPLESPAWTTQLEPVLGPSLAQQAQMLGESSADAIKSFRSRQKSFSLGARWDLASQVSLKLQWDHIRVEPNGSVLWGNASTQPTRANVGSLVVDFVF